MVENIEKAYNLAVQEDKIRDILGANAKGEQESIDLISEFLATYPECTESWGWGGHGTLHQIEALGKFIGKLGCISEDKGINALVLNRIFCSSDLFKPFYMLSRDIRFSKEVATNVVNNDYPEGNYRAYNTMDEIFNYLTSGK